MSKRDKQEFLAILESMTVESASAGGPGIYGHVGYTDVLVAGEHVARAEYLPRMDRYTIDTTSGEFQF